MNKEKKPNIINNLLQTICIFLEVWAIYLPIIYFIIAICYHYFDIYLFSIFALYFSKTPIIYSDLIKEQITTITTVSAILIGFFVTSMSVFGTSLSHAVIKLSEEPQRTEQFIRYSSFALLFAFITLIFSILLDIFPGIFIKTHLFISFFTLMLISAIRFTIIVIIMYSINIKTAKDYLELEKHQNKQLLEVLNRLILKEEKETNEYYDNLLDKMESKAENQSENAPSLKDNSK